jgi:hypothetical protein
MRRRGKDPLGVVRDGVVPTRTDVAAKAPKTTDTVTTPSGATIKKVDGGYETTFPDGHKSKLTGGDLELAERMAETKIKEQKVKADKAAKKTRSTFELVPTRPPVKGGKVETPKGEATVVHTVKKDDGTTLHFGRTEDGQKTFSVEKALEENQKLADNAKETYERGKATIARTEPEHKAASEKFDEQSAKLDVTLAKNKASAHEQTVRHGGMTTSAAEARQKMDMVRKGSEVPSRSDVADPVPTRTSTSKPLNPGDDMDIGQTVTYNGESGKIERMSQSGVGGQWYLDIKIGGRIVRGVKASAVTRPVRK